jgi:hypothetical protein
MLFSRDTPPHTMQAVLVSERLLITTNVSFAAVDSFLLLGRTAMLTRLARKLHAQPDNVF